MYCTDVMFAGKNLYNNEHVAIKLVIQLFDVLYDEWSYTKLD